MIEGFSAKLEHQTRHHYGATEDIMKLVPVVSDRETAHRVAIGVNRGLDNISEKDIQDTVDRGILRAKWDTTGHEETDPAVIRENVIKHALTMVAVNAEIEHARLAPQDFNEDARQAGPNPMPPVN